MKVLCFVESEEHLILGTKIGIVTISIELQIKHIILTPSPISSLTLVNAALIVGMQGGSVQIYNHESLISGRGAALGE